MKEQAWDLCKNPVAMVRFLQEATTSRRSRWQGWIASKRFPIHRRKWLLFGCAVCDHFPSILPVAETEELLLTLSRFADGEADPATITEVGVRFRNAVNEMILNLTDYIDEVDRNRWLTASRALLDLFERCEGYSTDPILFLNSVNRTHALLPHDFVRKKSSEIADLLREVIGNPMRSAIIEPAWREWNDGVIVKLALTAYEDRRFDLLPILSDALQEAGCSDEAILAHCVSDKRHVRGCWVLDAILDRN